MDNHDPIDLGEQKLFQVKLLFIVLPSWDMPKLTARILPSLQKYCDKYSIVKTKEDYYGLEDRYEYEILAAWGLPGFVKEIVADQLNKSKSFKYMHSLSVGVDEVCSIKEFRECPIRLTNARGAFSEILAEYVLMGMLYHAKHVEYF